MSQLFKELKRRNVFRVAIAYLAVVWAILQVADIVLENIAAPEWLMQVLMLFMVIGFPIAIIFAWAFEITPEGLKKESEVDRSQSITGTTGKKLDRVIIAVLGVAVVFLLLDKFLLNESSTATKVTDQSVAVLPFIAMSSGPDDEYFADGLTEEILNSLTRIPDLLVTARTSSFHFKGQDLPVPEIAATLGVAHVVEGSVRRDGDRLRVTAQLIRAADGFHLWSENYDRNSDDTFGVQTDIAEKIAIALDVVLDEEQRAKMRDWGVRDPAAFIAYQKGIEVFDNAHGSESMLQGLAAANDLFAEALRIEPSLADAYIYQADYFTHFLMDTLFDDSVSDAERDEALRRNISLHEGTIRAAASDAHRIYAEYDLAVITGAWNKLPALIDELVAVSPCGSPSWSMETTLAYGHAEKTLATAKSEIECNPMSFNGWTQVVAAYAHLGNDDAAISAAETGIEKTGHVRIFQQLVFVHMIEGRFDAAQEIIDRHILDPRLALPMNATLAAAQGDVVTAEALLEQVVDLGENMVRPIIAQLAQLGQRDRANELAASIDARPNGHLLLMLYPQICRCGAPWDIEATPNFAKLIDAADLQWPPESPIEWPLKSW